MSAVRAMSIAVHTPAAQAPLPPEQGVPSATLPCAGHEAALPVQVAACKHSVALAHWVVDGLNESAGHADEEPVQLAPLSHGPLAAKHAIVDGANVSDGQLPELPVQLAPIPQGPVGARHCVLAATNVQLAEQQDPAMPFAAPLSHCSVPLTMPLPQDGTHAGLPSAPVPVVYAGLPHMQ